MLSNISWASYGYALAFTLHLYYALMIALYFKGEIGAWIRRKLSFISLGNFSPQDSTINKKLIMSV